MTPPSPEAVAAAVERLKGEVAAARRIQKINPFLYHFMDDVDTLIAALAEQSEELAKLRQYPPYYNSICIHHNDAERQVHTSQCPICKMNRLQEELSQARKDVERFRDGIGTALATLKNYIPRSGSLVDAAIDVLEGATDRQPSKAGNADTMQEQKTTPPEGPASDPASQ